jgi:hypothetical protein
MTTSKPQGSITDKTIGELVTELLELDQSLPIVMSKDSEGNSYSPLFCWDVATYYPDVWSDESLSTYSGAVDHPDDKPDEWKGRTGVKALVLWPEN